MLAADNLRLDAMRAGDAAVLAGVLSNDLTYIHSNGDRDDKPAYLASVRDKRVAYHDITVAERRATALADNVVLMEGRLAMQIRYGGGDKTVDALFQAIWLCEGAQWRLRAWQSTNTPQP